MDTINQITLYLTNKQTTINNYLKDQTPLALIFKTLIAAYSIQYLVSLFRTQFKTRWGESGREKMGRLLRHIPIVEKEYRAFLKKETDHAVIEMSEKWKEFGEPITEIPEKGWSFSQVTDLINKYNALTVDPLKHTHTSGSIYSNTFTNSKNNCTDQLCKIIEKYSIKHSNYDMANFTNITDKEYFENKTRMSEFASIIAFIRANKWNPLHDEFKVGIFIERQVVAMIADFVGATKNQMSGVMTSGGTESLMLALHSYRNWGIEKKGLAVGEPVVIVSSSVHAAVFKAGLAYNIRIIEAETDINGRVSMQSVRNLLNKYKKYVVAIIGSSPSYPTGTVDPIEQMGALAKEYGVGFHVDCCLGGFVLKNEYANVEGVTSISFDIHKFGLCAKGSSVLLCNKIDDEYLNYYSIYAIPYWRGGIYGTSRDLGSYSAANALIALITLLIIGKEGYYRQRALLFHTIQHLMTLMEEFSDRICLVNNIAESPILTLRMNPSYIGSQGAIYAFADEMKDRGFLLSKISNDMIHFCLTIRFACDPDGIQKYKDAVCESLDAVYKRNELGEVFSTIGGYGSLTYSQKPTLESVRKVYYIVKFCQNWLLGTTGAKDAIRKVIMVQNSCEL
ncbi:MAG: sphingosine-1-phosphate lyase 1 [Homavirus sp.]|uniref:Sphingosine-1-phosphate lyase 1 n=1 Tax=Homavirus sp. TaxID=2487769 RepID=A0A3G5A547_9VIRU|nr:MAG: sphingosine-1-phosphate lyase 1 [Homavirus sp.]